MARKLTCAANSAKLPLLSVILVGSWRYDTMPLFEPFPLASSGRRNTGFSTTCFAPVGVFSAEMCRPDGGLDDARDCGSDAACCVCGARAEIAGM